MGRKDLIRNFWSLVTKRNIQGKRVRLVRNLDTEIDSESTANGPTAVNTKFFLEDDQIASLANGLVPVVEERDAVPTTAQAEDLPRYPEQELKTTTQNYEASQVLNYLRNKNVEKIQHYYSFGEYMNRLWSAKEMCDVEIHIEDTIFFTHRIMLSFYSSQFSNFFSGLTGKRAVPIAVVVNGFSSEAFRVFLEFVYDRKFNAKPDILEEVMRLADDIDVPVLKERCHEFLVNMTLEEAFETLIAKRHSPTGEQIAFAVSRVSKEFSKFCNSDRFLELDIFIFCKVLANDDLQISTEMEVFRAALKWVNHSLVDRRQYLSRVMQLVRYPYMTQKELFECIQTNDLLEGSSEMRNIIKEANWVVTARILGEADPLNVQISAPRSCFTGKSPATKTVEFED